AMANIVFCRPGAAAVEIFPEYCVQPHFRALAHCAGLHFGMVQGTAFESEAPRNASRSWRTDFVIDLKVLGAAVEAAERVAG
ncbi:glycosyltransferase family 61 protein, partial [Klebsiella pneumoniae]|nr:glycosyltransferase family 61 protein [Klebsiella pneumoniae]